MKKLVLLCTTIVLILNCNAQVDSLYFGQTLPGDIAKIFASGIISLSNRDEGKVVFSPNGKEIFIEVIVNQHSKIFYTRYINNNWTEQVAVPFTGNDNVGLPFLSADGNKLYFTNWANKDIYRIERSADIWGAPQLLPSPINSTSSDVCYTETDNGVVYMSSRRQGGVNG
jgi:hypothetical protein